MGGGGGGLLLFLFFSITTNCGETQTQREPSWSICPISRVWSPQVEENETDGQTDEELGRGMRVGVGGQCKNVFFFFFFLPSVLLFRPDITTMADWA